MSEDELSSKIREEMSFVIRQRASQEFYNNSRNKPKLIKENLHVSKGHSENAKRRLSDPKPTIERKSALIKRQLESGIKKLFNALDLDHNGQISIEDLNTKSNIEY